MLNGLDLFSGIAGNSLALGEYIRTVAYCERDEYARGVLLSRMASGELRPAPIWDDVTTLRGDMLPAIDIIVGGFPCQDLSVAGRGAGLEGKRSGLFFEIVRLAKEIKPAFLFLENVPAIRTRGLSLVARTLSDAGYDLRWCSLSAAEVGAHHKRDRWFLLAAHAERLKLRDEQGRSRGTSWQRAAKLRDNGAEESLADGTSERRSEGRTRTEVWSGGDDASSSGENVADALCSNRHRRPKGLGRREQGSRYDSQQRERRRGQANVQWEPEPDVDRVVNGLSNRVDRIKCLGNAVVPKQAKAAFEILMGYDKALLAEVEE